MSTVFDVRYAGVIRLVFLVLPSFLDQMYVFKFVLRKQICDPKSTKNQIENRTSPYLVMDIESACLLIT